MSCCNGCFAWAIATKEEKERLSFPQGHILCRPPTEEEIDLYARGGRSQLINNKWVIFPPNPPSEEK